jgi:hypothetical protein
MALLWGCNPQVSTDEGNGAQASEAGGDKPGAPANDGNPPPKDPPQGGCDPGDPNHPPKDPNGDPTVCTDVVLGDGVTCTAGFKDEAIAACDAQKMVLAGLYEPADCPGGSTSAKVHCCVPGGGGGQQASCTGFAIGDGVTCTADADIKDQALTACAAQGMGLVNLWEAFDCPGGESTIAKVECCGPGGGGGGGGAGGGGGDPGNCAWLTVGDGATCTADADIKNQAMAACTQQNMALVNLGEAFDCPGGESTIAKVECCAPASP